MATDGDDRIGYGRPPKATRFKPGQSGNPKGRPKHARNLKTEFLEELNEIIRVREGDREMKISKQRAFVKALVAAAIKGDMRAANALVSFCNRAFGDERDESSSGTATHDLEILEEFVSREVRKRADQDSPKKIDEPKSFMEKSDE
jgi:hypothetical protein